MSREWKRFGIALAIGALAVFLYEIVDLVRHLAVASHPHDRGAVWSVLFMIAAIFLAVGGIGFGLARAIRRERRGGDTPPGEINREEEPPASAPERTQP